MQDLYRFAGKSVVYLARIDQVRPVYKYGISRDIYRRILKSHRQTFPTFDLEMVRVTPHREQVEKLLTYELTYLGIHHKEKYNGKLQRELILLPHQDDLPEVKRLIDRIIEHTAKDVVLQAYSPSDWISLDKMDY